MHRYFAERIDGLPEADAFWEDYSAALFALIDGELRPFADALATVEELRERGVAVAVASSSPRARLDRTLRRAGLADAFAVSVAGDEIEHGKPAPDMFLAAAAEAGRRRRAACAVIEDSAPGVAAGLAAGMRTVAIVRDGEDPARLADAHVVLRALARRRRAAADAQPGPGCGQPPTSVRTTSRRSSSTTTSAGVPGASVPSSGRPASAAGTVLAAASASPSGAPSAWSRRTAASIVSALPASRPVGVADDAALGADGPAAEGERAVARAAAAATASVTSASRPRAAAQATRMRVAGDVMAVGDELHGHVVARERGEGEAGLARRRRPHRVEEVRDGADAAVERGVRLRRRRVGVAGGDERSRARSARRSAPPRRGAPGARVTCATGPAARSRSSRAAVGVAAVLGRVRAEPVRVQERALEVRARGTAARRAPLARASAAATDASAAGHAPSSAAVITVGRYAVTPVASIASPAAAQPSGARAHQVDAAEAVDLQVDEPRRGDPAAARLEPDGGDRAVRRPRRRRERGSRRRARRRRRAAWV